MPRARLSPDQPLVVGMVLADEDGYSGTITYVGTRIAMISCQSIGGLTHSFIRGRYPFLISMPKESTND